MCTFFTSKAEYIFLLKTKPELSSLYFGRSENYAVKYHNGLCDPYFDFLGNKQ